MILSIPQFCLLSIMLFGCIEHIFKSGRARPVSNFYILGILWLFEVWVLSTTPFFNQIKLPQGLWCALSFLGLLAGVVTHGKTDSSNVYSGPLSVFSTFIMLTIFYFGGFFQ